MNLFEDTNPRALKDLLAEVHSLQMVLPDFQRDFVWEPGATQELIVSIANNYPAGSILSVRDTRPAFACREFEGTPKLANERHIFLVLDGQQRLTSLYQAFYGVGEHRYYLDLRKLIDGADFEETIFHVRATTKWAQARETFELQARDLILPLSVLQGGSGRFSQWSRQVARRLSDQERIRLEDSLDQIAERCLPRVRDCVLNRTLIDRTTNQMISNRAPSEYFDDIRKTSGFPLDAVLASHCLPCGDSSPFWTNDYEAFLSWREKRLWREIQCVTGLREAADLEATLGDKL